MNTGPAANARALTITLWAALCASLLLWAAAGYSWLLCLFATLPLLAPLRGLILGRRYTYAWATLFAIPYFAFAVTEILVNPAARWVAGATLVLVFAWFCAMVVYLRSSPAQRG